MHILAWFACLNDSPVACLDDDPAGLDDGLASTSDTNSWDLLLVLSENLGLSVEQEGVSVAEAEVDADAEVEPAHLTGTPLPARSRDDRREPNAC